MIFADLAIQSYNVLSGMGLAGLVIAALGAAVIYLHRQLIKEQEGRLQDAKETRDKLTELSTKIYEMVQPIYDNVVSNRRRR